MEEKIEVKTEKQGKFEAFLDKNFAILFAPIIVAFLYVFALWRYDVYPFGGEYTAASYDLSAQICPFIEHLFDVMKGKSSLTYSYAIVGGADVTGTFLYFFVSPFSFLFLIFGEGRVAHASSIVMLCKLMAIAVAGAWFAKKMFKDIPDYLCIALGVVYTYCGYTFVSNTYINWMDFLIYLPFCVWAFRRFVETDNFAPFSILSACCIYTCFSIACFSLFTVFPALIAYALLCVKKERRGKFITRLCLSFVVAILIALPVLIPALRAFMVSGRGGGIFDNLWVGFSVNSTTGEIGKFNSSTFTSKYSQSLYRKWSYILSDSVFVVLTLVWLFKTGLKDKFAQFMLVCGVFTLLPTVVDEAMNLMNMGSYMSYALRFGFLNAIYFFGGACLCIESVCHKPFCAFDGTQLFAVESQEDGGRYELKSIFRKENKSPLIWSGVCLFVALLALVFLIWFVSGDNFKTFFSAVVDDSDTIKSVNGFSSSFAHSTGGLTVIIVLFLVVALVTVVGSFMVGSKKISPAFLSVLLVVIVGVQATFYNSHLVLGNRSVQHVELESYAMIMQELNARNEDEYFRVKDYGDEVSLCAQFTVDSNSFSVFSSVIDADNFATYELFGYKGNGKNSYESAHNTDKKNRSDEFGDAFMGYKYFFVPSKKKSAVEKLSYMKPVMVTGADGKETQLEQGGFYAFENEIVFPLGYRVNAGDYKYVAPANNNSTNRKNNQKALYEFLRGKTLAEMQRETGSSSSEFVTPATASELSKYLWGKAADVKVGAGEITATVTAEKGECLFLNFVASNGYTVTVNGKEAQLIENDLKFLSVALEEGENVVVFKYSSPYPKCVAIGVGLSVVSLFAVAFVLKKTKIVDKCAPVVAWVGVGVAIVVVAFFMVYPTGVFVTKLIELLRGFLV